MPNLFEPDWDASRDETPFKWRRARLGRQTGAEPGPDAVDRRGQPD